MGQPNEIEELLGKLLESAKGSRSGIIAIKSAAVKNQQFELASKIRELEKELFPETKEEKTAKERASHLNLVFRMVGLNISKTNCWLIDETLKAYNKKKGKFSVDDGVDLEFKAKELFIYSED